MKRIGLVVLLLAVSGCGSVAVSSMRTNFDGDDQVLTHCETIQEARPNKLSEGNSEFDDTVRASSLDGWKLAYVAQYTRGIKSKITVRYCLEKKYPKDDPRVDVTEEPPKKPASQGTNGAASSP